MKQVPTVNFALRGLPALSECLKALSLNNFLELSPTPPHFSSAISAAARIVIVSALQDITLRMLWST